MLPARRATGPYPGRGSSGPLVGELLVEVTDQGNDGGGHTKTARGPASEPSDEQRLGVSVVPGSTRSLQLSVSAALRRIGSSAALVPELVGGDEETRTPDPLLAKEMLCQLSYVPLPGWVVGVSGLEPETSALSGQCSNQLS